MTPIRPLLMLLLLTALVAEEAVQPAGSPELRQIERQIVVMNALVADARAELDRHQTTEVNILDDLLGGIIREYQPYAGPLPQTSEEHLAMYPQMLRNYTPFHFDPLEPVDPWVRAWIAHRKEEHRLNDRYQEVRVSLQRLKRLRARLRGQLGLPPEP